MIKAPKTSKIHKKKEPFLTDSVDPSEPPDEFSEESESEADSSEGAEFIESSGTVGREVLESTIVA